LTFFVLEFINTAIHSDMKRSLLLLCVMFSLVMCKKEKKDEDINNSGSTATTNTSTDIVPFTVSVTINGETTNFQYGTGDLQLLHSSSVYLTTNSASITPAASLSDIPNSGSSNPGYLFVQLPPRYAARTLWEEDPAQFFINYFNETYSLTPNTSALFDVLLPNGDFWYLSEQANAGNWISSYEIIEENSPAIVRVQSNLLLSLKNSVTEEIATASVNLTFQFRQPD
jgi:hypothetical protein